MINPRKGQGRLHRAGVTALPAPLLFPIAAARLRSSRPAHVSPACLRGAALGRTLPRWTTRRSDPNSFKEQGRRPQEPLARPHSMTNQLPDDLIPSHKSPTFTQDTLPTPAGRTHPGTRTLGVLNVLEGSLRFVNIETGEERLISAPDVVTIRPGLLIGWPWRAGCAAGSTSTGSRPPRALTVFRPIPRATRSNLTSSPYIMSCILDNPANDPVPAPQPVPSRHTSAPAPPRTSPATHGPQAPPEPEQPARHHGHSRRFSLSRRHDQSYKLLFSLPLAVEHMIRGFVDNRLADELDFTRAESLGTERSTPRTTSST